MIDWAEMLRSFRQRNGLKQEAAASLLGVSQAYISKVENGAVQPSTALLKRLETLSRQPDHRPTVDLMKAAVRHAPSLTALLRLVDGQVVVAETSWEFLDAGHPFDQHPRHDVMDFQMMNEDASRALQAIVRTGAFEGRFGYIETVWESSPRCEYPVRYFKAIFVPLRTDEGEWLLQVSLVEISQEQLEKAKLAWDGFIRFFKHDEEPPRDWP